VSELERAERLRAAKRREAPVHRGAPDRVREPGATPAAAKRSRQTGLARHGFDFRIGNDLPAALARAAQEIAAAQPVRAAQLRRLQRVAREHDTPDQVGEMFLAGLLDADNARALSRTSVEAGAVVSFSLQSIRAGRPQVKALRRRAKPPPVRPARTASGAGTVAAGRSGIGSRGAAPQRLIQRKGPGGMDPETVDALLKALTAGGGATAAEAAAAGTGAAVVTVAGVALLVVAAVGGLTLFYVEASRRSGRLAEERVRRSHIAQNLREMGLITEEEAIDFILNGHLFIPVERVHSMSARHRWWLLDVTRLELSSSMLGYQVYVLKTRDGRVLYVGKSGGSTAERPTNWTDRMRAHLEDQDKIEWIGETDRIEVHAELTEIEALALEEVLIRLNPEAHNKLKDEFSTKHPQVDIAGAAKAALKRPKWNFRTDIYPMPRLGNARIPQKKSGEKPKKSPQEKKGTGKAKVKP
jgi:hypothetical protein